jgi:hypothetical protein
VILTCQNIILSSGAGCLSSLAVLLVGLEAQGKPPQLSSTSTSRAISTNLGEGQREPANLLREALASGPVGCAGKPCRMPESSLGRQVRASELVSKPVWGPPIPACTPLQYCAVCKAKKVARPSGERRCPVLPQGSK